LVRQLNCSPWKSLWVVIFAGIPAATWAQSISFVAPPRTIADITAVLDQEKPDPKVAANLRGSADAKPPANIGRGEIARFLLQRCSAHSLVGEFNEAISDCEKAVEHAQTSLGLLEIARYRQVLAIQYAFTGDPKKALQILLQTVSMVNVKGARGYAFNA